MIEQRLAARKKESAHGSDAGLDVYQKLAADFVEPSDEEEIRSICMDSNLPVDECLEKLLLQLLGLVE